MYITLFLVNSLFLLIMPISLISLLNFLLICGVCYLLDVYLHIRVNQYTRQ